MRKALLVSVIFFGLVGGSNAQSDIIDDVGVALKASSAKELVKYCHSSVEIQVDGIGKTYNKPQAEIILKSFFDKNESTGFRYVHQGASSEGYKYTIGKYTTASASYRVYYLLKKGADTYTIHTISFSKE